MSCKRVKLFLVIPLIARLLLAYHREGIRYTCAQLTRSEEKLKLACDVPAEQIAGDWMG